MTPNANHTTLRIARPSDADRIVEIYHPYVLHTGITFECEVPTTDEMARRIATTLERYPYLVAEDPTGLITGYAYAAPFKQRAAYDHAVELSIYLDHAHRGKGIGRMMYQAMEDCLVQQHVTNLNACITYLETEDALHSNASIGFHEHMGYVRVAHFHRCGYKLGRWWDIVWLEKMVSPHLTPQPPFVPFADLL